MTRVPIEYEIGFADSEIISYTSQKESLVILVKCWDETLVKIEFFDCILFLILDSWNVSDICEATESPLFERAVRKVYDVPPKEIEYKIFQFIDNDDDPVVEIACKRICISLATDRGHAKET